jgi:acyl-CoA synthetase (AMP-forming)/AMP-acid ligase II
VVPGETLPDRPTIGELIHRGVARWGDQPLLIHDGVVHTWHDVDAASAELAKRLIALGATKGSRVGLLMPNSADWVIAFLAATRIGAMASLISTFLQASELANALARGDVQILLCVDRYLSHDYLARLDQLPGISDAVDTELYLPRHPYLRRIVVWGGDTRPWAERGDHPPIGGRMVDDQMIANAEAAVSPADLLLTIWTSGTTADPKGVMHTHGSVLRYIHALRQIGRGDVYPGEHAYAAMPFFWLGGLNTVLLPALVGGGVVVTTSEVTASSVLDVLIANDVTRVAGWMGPMVELVRTAGQRGIDISGIRGLAVPQTIDGTPIPTSRRGNALGMTETFGPHSAEIATAALPPGKESAMGRGVPGCERQIVDPVTGAPMAVGEIGELRVRSLGMMAGYYNRERRDCFDADGWFRTGDRCSIDADGYLFFHGRESELIKTSGANVSPREVESVLQAWPEIAEAMVFGIADEVRGEAVVAAVIPAEGADLDEASVRARLREEVSHYKVPQQVVIVAAADVPRTDSGKPRKAALRDRLFATGRR